MLCFGISEQEIESALGNIKVTFCNSTAVADKPVNLEQCVKALKVAVDTLAKIKKNGKRALNKDENIDLRKEIVDVYKELTQLQGYSGPDKAQRCLEFSRKWRNGVNIPDLTQPQLRPPVHQSRRSVDSASLSSGGSHSIPDKFYHASLASRSGSSDTHDEENSNGSTPGSSEVALNVPCIKESNGDPGDGDLSHPVTPKRPYDKHTGRFADAAPRTAHEVAITSPASSITEAQESVTDDEEGSDWSSIDSNKAVVDYPNRRRFLTEKNENTPGSRGVAIRRES
ncbi:hypothetical protein BGX34_000577 [Mortierella sp. NVP85]|nr:hypothetical protein BGX34_000577 [Mortierella sp. NVP85]